MKISLLGFMGSGKSTIGIALAKQLNINFIDLDNWIEENEKKTISDIFEQQGESHFRKLEKKYLEKILQEKNNFVLALGGGAPCFFDNMDLLNNNSTTVYLEVPTEELAKRLLEEQNKRPLLQDFSFLELLHFVQQKVKDRYTYYEQAKFTIAATGIIEDIVGDIKNTIRID